MRPSSPFKAVVAREPHGPCQPLRTAAPWPVRTLSGQCYLQVVLPLSRRYPSRRACACGRRLALAFMARSHPGGLQRRRIVVDASQALCGTFHEKSPVRKGRDVSHGVSQKLGDCKGHGHSSGGSVADDTF